MDWVTILSACGIGSVLSIIVTAIANRRKTTSEIKQTDASIYEAYTARLESRIGVLEDRTQMLEVRNATFLQALNCAYRCENHEQCPVLDHLSTHPLPMFDGKGQKITLEN